MAKTVTRPEVHSWLKDYLKDRPELGLGKAILAAPLEPPNPFESQRRRLPRKAFVLAAFWLLALAGVFIYFNWWL
jgi:hypothetical protein